MNKKWTCGSHIKRKKKEKKRQSNNKRKMIQEEQTDREFVGGEIFFLFISSLRFFSDSRKTVRQNSSG